MKRIYLLFFVLTHVSAWSQNLDLQSFRIGFYNLENLFDTIKDKGKEDYEFLPSSQKHWNTEKYNAKINNLARAIANIGDWEGPDILGVCEVEHQSCLEDLVNKTTLKNFNYGIIHQESEDERGIDVACIYKKDKLELIDYQYIKVNFDYDTRPTRDILYVKGRALGKDTIHVFYNHWPSRFGGAAASEPKRFLAAQTLRKTIDSILAISPNANIVISGDFNDGTEDISIKQYLQAKTNLDTSQTNYLFNTSYYKQNTEKLGTHKYQDEWNLFDQIIVSSVLLDSNKTIFCSQEDSYIHGDKEWLNESDLSASGTKPFRSYVGANFNNGYSDHYAVSLVLWLK